MQTTSTQPCKPASTPGLRNAARGLGAAFQKLLDRLAAGQPQTDAEVEVWYRFPFF